jgi:hypothetical protein
MLGPNGEYTSREIPLNTGDLLLLYTDGLAEARSGEQLFGEDRVATAITAVPRQVRNALTIPVAPFFSSWRHVQADLRHCFRI